MTGVGGGFKASFPSGMFQLPIPDHDDFNGLIYPFEMFDSKAPDDRIIEQKKNFGLVVVIYPVKYQS